MSVGSSRRGWPRLNSLQRKLGKWRALRAWERRLLVESAGLLVMAWLGLRLLDFKRVRRFSQPEIGVSSFPGLPRDTNAVDYGQRCAELVGIAGRHGFYKATCLPQALVLCRVLRRRGLPAQLRIGVRPQVAPFEAHAWVELDHKVLGPNLDGYVAFPDSEKT